MKPRLFSGMQPTGALHLGNYMGALSNWVRLLDDYDCIFCIVDLHALTIPYDREQMETNILNAALDYIAGGLDPERCTIFVQSHVLRHAELAWVLNTVTPLGQLMRMTQFKAKTEQINANEMVGQFVTGQEKETTGSDAEDVAFDELGQDDDFGRSEFLAKAGRINAGLLTYPVLQAADIMLYKGEAVPVGEDQVQHVELTRFITRRFNHRFGPVFPECRALLSEAARLVGLDGQAKMSKSLGNHIPLMTPPEEVLRRVTREAVSDSRRQRRSDPGVPEECNIHAWHKVFSSEEEIAWSAEGCRSAGIGCFECKKRVAENINARLEPYRARREELSKRPDDVRDVLAQGARRCNDIAEGTMKEVYGALGLYRP